MVRAKKHLGQHFLRDDETARRIAALISLADQKKSVVEIGPGTGVLTQYLVNNNFDLTLIEIDVESVDHLKRNYSSDLFKILNADFLRLDFEKEFDLPSTIIGNFPYNISSQIFFKILEMPDQFPEIVCMLQREVAERIASDPGRKSYGILSVLLQAYYDIEYHFTVSPEQFLPPPKVYSGVISLRKRKKALQIDNKTLFFKVVKSCFQNRRKKLRNGLKNLNLQSEPDIGEFKDKRPETLSPEEFLFITSEVDKCQKKS